MKIDNKGIVRECELESSGTRNGPEAGSCVHCTEISGSIIIEEIVE